MAQEGVLFVIVCVAVTLVGFGAAQDTCDPNSDTYQCGRYEICRDGACQPSNYCDDGFPCSRPDDRCMSNTCNPQSCTTTGQCAYRFMCSDPRPGRCVEVSSEPQVEGGTIYLRADYRDRSMDLRWWKGSTDNLVAWGSPLHPGGIYYYGPFCADSSPCVTSPRASLNMTSGALVISNVQVEDEGLYYHSSWIPGDEPKGTDEVQLAQIFVVPNEEEISIQGLPTDVTDGATYPLTCAIERIKPEANVILWHFDGMWYMNGTITSSLNEDGVTFNQQGVLDFTFNAEDNGKQLTCTYNHTTLIYNSAREIINIGAATDLN